MEYASGCHAPEPTLDHTIKTDAEIHYLQPVFNDRYAQQYNNVTDMQKEFIAYFGRLHVQQREELLEEATSFAAADRTHLRDSEVVCLLVAFVASRESRAVGYADVLEFAYSRKAKLSEATIFKAFSELETLHLLARAPGRHVTRAGRPRELFNLTSFGVIALELAVAYQKHLRACREQVAA